jgi:hypothetical protein
MSWVAVAVVGGAVIGAGASIYSADKSSGAVEDAANANKDTQTYIYNENKKLFEPYYNVGVAALPGLTSYDATHPYPSYEDMVSKPMESWDYTQSPAYKAKYTLGSEALNNQLQARGLNASGIGANRAADLSRRLTAEDYNSERAYRTGQLTDKYRADLASNTDQYNRILDQIRVGQGAASSLGTAGNQYATGVGQATMDAGKAEGAFYAGLPGATLNVASTALKAYDTGQRAGWWGNSGVDAAGQNAANIAYNPSMQPDTGALYGL